MLRTPETSSTCRGRAVGVSVGCVLGEGAVTAKAMLPTGRLDLCKLLRAGWRGEGPLRMLFRTCPTTVHGLRNGWLCSKELPQRPPSWLTELSKRMVQWADGIELGSREPGGGTPLGSSLRGQSRCSLLGTWCPGTAFFCWAPHRLSSQPALPWFHLSCLPFRSLPALACLLILFHAS